MAINSFERVAPWTGVLAAAAWIGQSALFRTGDGDRPGQASAEVIQDDLWRNHEELHLEGRYMTNMIAEEAVKFVHDHAQQPFLLCVTFNAPHYPMQAPERYIKPYEGLEPNRRIHDAMVAALDEIGPGSMTIEGRPFRVDLE